MKFPQLPVGQRFVFQDEVYAKVGPVTARRERDGEQRLIPRSAAIAPTDSPRALGRAGAERRADGPWGLALDAYEREVRACLGGLAPALADGLESAMERGRSAFLTALERSERKVG